MTRRLYRWLVLLHPPAFRRRFGPELLCIFDDAPPGEAWAMVGDGMISLFRQWILRSRFPIILAACAGAAVQFGFGSLIWSRLVGRSVAHSSAFLSIARTAHDNAMVLLLIAGVITVLVLSGTLLSVWCAFTYLRRPDAARRARVIVVAAILGACFLPTTRAQSTAARPSFEVASVKRNVTSCAGGRGGGGGAPQPGSLRVTCIAVMDLIQAAYGTFANGPTPDQKLVQVLGLPDWADTDLFDIEARPAGKATIDQMYGPMLQVLLEDRFQLKIHRETRQLPVYSLTVGKGGAKLSASTCTPIDLNHPAPAAANGPAPAFCGRTSMGTNAGVMSIDAIGLTMASFAGITLSARVGLDRPVLDETGLAGVFDIHLKYAPGADSATAPATNAPSLFAAIQEQLGLKISPGKGPVEVLVVDRMERPSGN